MESVHDYPTSRLARIDYKLKLFEKETKQELLEYSKSDFLWQFIHWMNEKHISVLYMTKYTDIDTTDYKYEIGIRLITRVAVEGEKLYEYDAKHVIHEDFNPMRMSRQEVIDILQDMENEAGRHSFGIKYQMMKSVGLNTYVLRVKTPMPSGFKVKNEYAVS